MRGSMEARVEGLIQQLKAVTDKAVCVGFGVSQPEQARARVLSCRVLHAPPDGCVCVCVSCGWVASPACPHPTPSLCALPPPTPPLPPPNHPPTHPIPPPPIPRAQAAQIKAWGADGVICGSALVRALGESGSAEEGLRRMTELARSMRAVL